MYSPDGRSVVTASEDETERVFEADTLGPSDRLLFPNLSDGHGKLERVSRREDQSTVDL